MPARAPSRRKPSQGFPKRLKYFGAYEGLQEELYLERLKYLIETSSIKTNNVQFEFDNVGGGNALGVAKAALLKNNNKEGSIAIFDHENCHSEFRTAIEYCATNKVTFSYSNICFDLWLILHKQDCSGSKSDSNSYKSFIRGCFNLDDEANIKEERVIRKIIDKLDIDDIKNAISRAEDICKNNKDIKSPISVSRHSVIYYDNPDLKIHEFVKKVLTESGIIKD